MVSHVGRAPSELVSEIETLTEQDVTLLSVQHKCQRLKLYTDDQAKTRVLRRAAERVRPRYEPLEPDPEALWEATKRLAAELEYKVSEINEIEIDLRDQDKPIAVVEMADLHIGGIGTDYDAIDRDTELIAKTDGMYCVVGGDNLDNFIQAFLLTGMAVQAVTASTQWLLFERYVNRISDKVLYARVGNHDSWTAKMSQVDKFGEMMREHAILNVEHIGVAHLLVGEQHYIVEATHKWWGTSKLNELHSAMRLLDYGIADNVDVAVVEHRHSPAAGWQLRRGKRRFLVRTGTYKVKDNYAAEHGFWGSEVAPACLIYWAKERRVAIMHDVPTAAAFLTWLRQS